MARALSVALLALLPLDCPARSEPLLCNEFSVGGVEEAMRARPGHDKVCHALGMALIRQGGTHDLRLQEAQLVFKTLLRLRPQGAFAYIGFAELRMRRRELGLRVEDTVDVIHDEAERATNIRPAMPEAYVTLGRANLVTGCLPCARRSADLARALGVNSPELAVLRSRIAELDGKPDEARTLLEQAIAAPGLEPEPRSWLLVAFAELQVRLGKLAEADRSFADAAEAQPDNLNAFIRRAEVRLYERGDLKGALEAGAASRRAASSIEIKRMRAIARYVEWSRDRIAGRATEDLRLIARASYVAPETALVACARYPVLAEEFMVMLQAGLVQRVDSRDEVGDTALLAAVAGGNANVVRSLIARAADVDAEDRRKRRPLSHAVGRSEHELLELLLRAGAVVDYVDMDGRSPLMLAVQRRDGVAAGLLLSFRKNQSPGLPAGAGDLLAAAATSDDAATMTVLLNAGIPAGTTDRQGRKALVVAVLWRSLSVARLLLERGADAAEAIEAARLQGDGEMLELLRSSTKRAI